MTDLQLLAEADRFALAQWADDGGAETAPVLHLGRCANYDGPHRDAPGHHCRRPATTRRTAGDYLVAVCETHSQGHGLWKLGRLFYGYDRAA